MGGFLIAEQLFDTYGLDSEVAQRILRDYEIQNKPHIEKIELATATVEELAELVYLRWNVAEEIVAYREANGGIRTLNELRKIKDFPIDKIDRIKLYLTLKK